MSNANGMNKDSGNVNWYTPSWVTKKVSQMYGGRIDLDPASCELANRFVGANEYYTEEDDGLAQQWYGKAWINHPYGRASNLAWANKIVESAKAGVEITGICYTSTSETWCNHILSFCNAVCFVSPRIKFIDARTMRPGPSAQKGSMIYYFGQNTADFEEHFGGNIHHHVSGLVMVKPVGMWNSASESAESFGYKQVELAF